MNKARIAKRLQGFLVGWLMNTVPGACQIRFDASGTVKVKDSLGWRDVGTVTDYLQVARALGAL